MGWDPLMTLGGKGLMPPVSRPFFESGTFTAPADGVMLLLAIGAGGSGAVGTTSATVPATGGYSGSWGVVVVKVKKNDVVTVSVGSGGAVAGAASTSGNSGGDTTITLNGVTYIAPGGPGGTYAASVAPTLPDGPAPSATWLYGASSVKPGSSAGKTGGAGVDILRKGSNATTSAASNGSGGGGTGYPSVDIHGGGALPSSYSLTGERYGVSFFNGDSQWGVPMFGGSGGQGYAATTDGGVGGNGGGGGGTTDTSTGGAAAGAGGFGGGGGAANRGAGGAGGLGGGGGAGSNGTGGKGGNGYAYVRFYPYMGA